MGTGSMGRYNVPVHREIMVDSMHQEVESEERRCVWKNFIDVEQKPVQGVFQQCPDEIAKEETEHRLHYRIRSD